MDKTKMIKDILDSRGQVMQFIRPRRFGKTLNLSMLRYCKTANFRNGYASMLNEIAEEYRRYVYILEKKGLLESEKERYCRIMEREATPIEYAKSLVFLSACLAKTEGQNVIILIDEYDVPLGNAYFKWFYCFLQALFGKSCKVFLENVASPNWRKLQSLD